MGGKEGKIMKVGIIVAMMMMMIWLQIMGARGADIECWNRIITCIRDADSIKQDCCDSIVEEITQERECFCNIKPTLSANATLLRTVNRLLSICSLTQSFTSLCPGPVSTPSPPSLSTPPSPPAEETEERSCWRDIGDCISNNRNRSLTEPELDPSSTSFNVTKYLCCPLMKQTAQLEKECFCLMNTYLQRNPEQARNVTIVLSACDIVDSSAALNTFCQSQPPTAAAPPPSQLLSSLLAGGLLNSNNPPKFPTPGSMEKLSGVSFVIDSNKTNR